MPAAIIALPRKLASAHLPPHPAPALNDSPNASRTVHVSSSMPKPRHIWNIQCVHLLRIPRPQSIQLKAALHAFITSIPQSIKSLLFRVASAAPRDWVMAAIMASNWLIGRPMSLREAAITAKASAAVGGFQTARWCRGRSCVKGCRGADSLTVRQLQFNTAQGSIRVE